VPDATNVSLGLQKSLYQQARVAHQLILCDDCRRIRSGWLTRLRVRARRL